MRRQARSRGVKNHATLVKIFRVIAKVPVLANDAADLYPISVRYIRRPK